MKGLLVKDLMLMKKQKSLAVMMIIISIVILISNSDASRSNDFVVTYLTAISTLLIIGTINYDAADNGLPFLFTLPFTRTTYVKEKYVLGMILGSVVWLVSSVFVALFTLATSTFVFTISGLLTNLILLLATFLILSFMIPLQLKFGAEKSRVVILVLVGGGVLIGTVLSKVFKINLMSLVLALNKIGQGTFFIGFFLLIMALMTVSYIISRKVMMNKEF